MDRSRTLFALVAATLALTIPPLSGGCEPYGCPPGTVMAMGRCVDEDAGVDGSVPDSGTLEDAGDSSADDSATDGGSGDGIVARAIRDEVPVSGLTVVFHDSTGAPVDVGTTNDVGEATSAASGVTVVTLVERVGSLTNLHTVQELQPRETVTFDLRGDTTSATRMVRLPGSVVGASQYHVSGSCSRRQGADPAGSFSVCDGTSSTHVTAFALDATSVPLAYAAALDAAPTELVSFDSWSTDFESVPATLVGAAGATLTIAEAELELDYGATLLSPGFEGRSGTMRMVRAPAHSTVLFAGYALEPIGAGSVARVVRIGFTDGVPASVEIDLDTAPRVTGFVPDRSDPARPAMSWEMRSDLDGSIDLSYFDISYSIPGTGLHQWSVYAGPTTRRVQIPELPAELAALRPTTEVPRYQVTIAAIDRIGSPSVIRAHPLRIAYGGSALTTWNGSY